MGNGRTAAFAVAVIALAGCGTQPDNAFETTTTTTSVVTATSTTVAEQSTTVAITPRTMVIDPRAGPAGTTIEVQGGGCPPLGVAITAITQDGTELEGAQAGHPDPSGAWRAEFQIKDLPPDATYEVGAVCYGEPGVIAFRYDPQRFDVTAGP